MTVLYHVVVKYYDNSGFVWDDFFCWECLRKHVWNAEHLWVLRCERGTPQYLSRIFPQLVNEPTCCLCGLMSNHWSDS